MLHRLFKKLKTLMFITLCGLCFSNVAIAYDLLMHKWRLASLYGHNIDMMQYLEKQPYILLQDNNRYIAYTGSEELSGGFSLVGQQLAFVPNSVNNKQGSRNSELEMQLLAMLPQVRYWSIDNQILSLKTATHKVIARFNY